MIQHWLTVSTAWLGCRLHSGPESSVVYAQTGRLYDSSKQYRRAAHYYKLHIMSNAGSAYLPGEHGEVAALICLAAAYDWDSVETGLAYERGHSCCKTADATCCCACQSCTQLLS